MSKRIGVRESRRYFLAWYALVAFCVLCALSAFVVGIVAALEASKSLGNVEFPLLIGGAVTGITAGVWRDQMGHPVWRRRLGRTARKQLRKERERILLDRAIQESEQNLRALGWRPAHEEEWNGSGHS